ncbi:galactose oxidase [Pedobacter sp. LMG 31464]|uniref:Galactose oxidase n=1 Tax=Pedobacter planticolens TaxID=2679964 RepID=A0A923DXN1_9SPHI|nr:galactose oxidase [Pedobacter planticolens]MBB2144698.1 galactose oxidase [Pedobacter planticolens]
MNRLFFYLLFFPFSMLITETALAQKKSITQVKWTTIAQLKNADGKSSLGFAGAINGFYNHALLVAGGANFPDKMPWEQGKKYYSKEVQISQKVGDNWQWNKNFKGELPEPIAYCGNTVTNLGIVYAGGENEQGLSNKAYLLSFSNDNNELKIKSLPNLPKAISNINLTSVGNVVYAVGGDEQTKSSNQFLSIDLDCETPEWKVLPNLPIALANSVVVAQQKDHDVAIYVIGGRSKTSTGISDLHHTTFAFDLKKKVWKTLAPISDGKEISNLSAAAGIAVGKNYILIPGGDNGKTFHQIELYLNQMANAKTDEEKTRLTAAKNELVIHHKGFYRGVLLYNTHTNTWSKISELPFLAPVTTTATKYGNSIILSNGEVKPGIRTPNIMLGEIKMVKF